jgi:hypothetical protein
VKEKKRSLLGDRVSVGNSVIMTKVDGVRRVRCMGGLECSGVDFS